MQPEAYRWAAVMALPLRLVVGWTYFSAFWRRLVLENKLIPDDQLIGNNSSGMGGRFLPCTGSRRSGLMLTPLHTATSTP